MSQNIQFLTLFYGVAKKYSTIANDFYITLKMCLSLLSYDIVVRMSVFNTFSLENKLEVT